MTMPAPDQLRLAAQWLDSYDESDDAFECMATVSAWLMQQAEAKEIRALGREEKIPVSAIRQRMKRQQQ